MLHVVFLIVGLVSTLFSLFHMLSVRRAGAQNPMAPDGLTSGERALVMITTLLGGLMFPGLIYYYGWKSRFPSKAHSVRVISWVYLAIYIVLFGGVGYLYYNYVVIPNAQKEGQALYDQMVQQNPTLNSMHQAAQQDEQAEQENQNANLTNGTTTTMTGMGYSINIPSQWFENKDLEETGSNYFVKQWNVFDLTQSVSVNWTSSTDPNNAELSTEASLLDSANSDSSGKFILSHPAISGATKTNMIVTKSGNYWRVDLFVHSKGTNMYQITGILQNSTPEQISAINQILMSFESTN